MRVSVVIPTYNSGPLVIEAVESVLAQTHPAAQIIVVDDGSTDDTPQRLSSFGDRIECVRQPNARVAAARNTGLAHATGDAVAFLDADDYWHPAKLERQIAALQERPEIGLVATNTFPWPGPMPGQRDDGPPLEILPLTRLLVCNPLTTSSVMVRRSVLAQAGRFDTDLHGPEDFDLWLRCARIASVAVLREPLTGYRDTTGSLGKQAETMRRGLLRIHEKLDAVAAWPSAGLRRKCRAHLDYSTGYLYFASGQPGQAMRLLASSLLTYPLPMSSSEVRYRFGRFRLLARAAWQGCWRMLPGRVEESS
jgi:glycosyltransferase involved in cell wall biosynthesis